MSNSQTAYRTVRVERDEHVAILSMNRPERRNALSPQLDEDLRSACADVANDDTVRAVVLRGEGQGFCAGADLTVLQENPTPDDLYEHLTTRYLPLVQHITEMPKPVIAAVNGVAAGAGCSLALACDLRVMADDASLLMAFSNIGFVPDSGASWLLARQIGYSRAFEVAAEGQSLPAERCLALGLTNRVVPAATLDQEARSWAAQLAQRPTLALGLTKRVMHYAMDATLAEVIEREAELQKQTLVSDDHREGVSAFMEKRTPEFKGS